MGRTTTSAGDGNRDEKPLIGGAPGVGETPDDRSFAGSIANDLGGVARDPRENVPSTNEAAPLGEPPPDPRQHAHEETAAAHPGSGGDSAPRDDQASVEAPRNFSDRRPGRGNRLRRGLRSRRKSFRQR